MVGAGVGIGTTAPNSNFQVASGLTTDLGGALKTGLLDTGYTAANAAAAVYNGTLSGSGPYLFTLTASNGNTYGNIPFGLTMPAGTSIIVTIIASSTSLPSSWGFATSSVVPAYVFGALTGTLQTFTATINVQQPTSILGVWMSGAVGNNITFTSFTVRYASSGPTTMLGNVGIGTTMPTTANFQIVKGQTVDLGGALQTAWQTAWTDYSTSSLTIGYNSTSYTYASTTGTYTLSNAGTDGVLLPAFGVVAGSPYTLQITLSTNGTQSPNSFTIRDRSNGTALTSVIINSITLPYVLQFTAPASGQIDFYLSVGVSKIVYITAFKLLRMDAMNVGIGTAAPISMLDVRGTIGTSYWATPVLNVYGGTGFDTNNIVNFQCQASQYGRNIIYMTGRYEGSNDGWSFLTPRNAIVFQTQSALNSAATQRFSIQNFAGQLGILSNGGSNTPITVWNDNGNVGIGVTNPTATLHVNGNIKCTTICSTSFTVTASSLATVLIANLGGNIYVGSTVIMITVNGVNLSVGTFGGGTVTASAYVAWDYGAPSYANVYGMVATRGDISITSSGYGVNFNVPSSSFYMSYYVTILRIS
jgi:hypothetical protein